ncbi:MAG: PstS family phosphate ABC transporter substrate-binding protein [Myxococcota bacterium]|nr:PstS family phosphate ABC transporter substrate-binding protein [Myxococcota bacterium]
MRYSIIVFVVYVAAFGCGKSDTKSVEPGAAQDQGKRTVIQNKGSDTLVNVAQAWAEAYAEVERNVAIAVTGGGSGTGISAMINGTVDIANASRKMKDKEIEAAKKNGIEPVEHVVGYDALAVFLHKDNPMNEATLAQLASIYGEGGKVEKWSDLNIKVPGCDSDEVVRVSRQNNSGTYAYFKKAVLGKGAEYKLGSRDMHGSKDVVELVAKTPCAIGYSGLAYATDHVKMPCIKKEDAAECVAPTIETASNTTYPIARPLMMYTAGQPTGKTKVYMDWIMSDTGQCIILKKGYAPIKPVTCK